MIEFTAGLDLSDEPHLISQESRTKHEFLLGPTGYGKSRYFDFRIRQDIEEGFGVCLIDPDGDAENSPFHSTLRWLVQKGYWHENPYRCARNVRILEIGSSDFVTSLNPFHIPEVADNQPEPWIVAKHLMAVMERVWQQDFSQYPTIQTLLPAVFVLMMEQGLSLLDASIILSNDKRSAALRQRLLHNAQDETAKLELLNVHEKSPDKFEASVLGPRNRLTEFTNIPRVRQMFSSGGTPLDLRRVMDEREILLVNLSPDDHHAADARVAKLVGTWLIREFYRLSRLRREPGTPFYLYVDEAADYLTDDIADILFKSRKRGLSLNLACQNLEQLRTAGTDGYGNKVYKAITENINIFSVFGGLRADAAEIVDLLFHLNDEQPVEVTARPMPNGEKIIVQLKSSSVGDSLTRSRTDTEQHAVTEVQSHAQALAEGTSHISNRTGSESQALIPNGGMLGDDGVVALNVGSSVASGFANSTMDTVITGQALAHTHGRARSESEAIGKTVTEGSQETLVDEYEKFYTSVKSIETVRYNTAALLKQLPSRHFFISVDRQPAERLYVPDVPDLNLAPKKLRAYINRISAADAFTMPLQEAEEKVKHPITALEEKLSVIAFPGDPDAGFNVSEQPETVVPFPGDATGNIPLKKHIPDRVIGNGETGVTYDDLFGECVASATFIKIIDPYLIKRHQIENLEEFLLMVRQRNPLNNEITVAVTTKRAEGQKYFNAQNGRLKRLKKKAATWSIHLDQTYGEPKLHSREIMTNAGWKIINDRSLDIYQQSRPVGKPDAQRIPQAQRLCYPCKVHYIHTAT